MTADTTYADAALFLGMNSADDTVRISCKAFFVDRLEGRVVMSQEQVGRCDDIIWGFSRELQDAYYPFMDNLHTVMDIHRPPYEEADIRRGLDEGLTKELPMHERLLLGMVLSRGGRLHSPSARLRDHAGLPITALPEISGPEPVFPEPLEQLYRESLVLRIPVGAL